MRLTNLLGVMAERRDSGFTRRYNVKPKDRAVTQRAEREGQRCGLWVRPSHKAEDEPTRRTGVGASTLEEETKSITSSAQRH